ncbi:MAG: oxidoreductase, partial [Gammaproteobacteria bacterium]|nr:oxidoreductase [Gammaproteobacteria bacterium]
YDEKTFAAFRALISKPLSSESDALALALQETAQQVWDLMQESNTHVYLAGLGRVAETFDRVMEQTAMSPKAWHETRDWIRAQGRWSELIYN